MQSGGTVTSPSASVDVHLRRSSIAAGCNDTKITRQYSKTPSLPPFSKGRGGDQRILSSSYWKKRRPSSSRRLLLLLLLFPPRRGNLMLRRKKSERRCFTRRGAAWAPCIVGCHLVTNRLSRTEYGTDCVSGRALF